MANRKGSPKTGGRVKGTPNKRTVELRALLASTVDLKTDHPLQVLARIYTGQIKQPVITGVDKKGNSIVVELPPSWDLRVRAASEVAQYLEPKRKAVELSDGDGNPLTINLLDLASLPAEGPK